MIVLLRTNELTSDARVAKYRAFFQARNIPHFCIGWIRAELSLSEPSKDLFFVRKAPFGAGSDNILSLLFWNFFLLKTLWNKQKEYQVIHACDFDTVLPALFIAKLLGKYLIFDIFDLYVDSRPIKNPLLRRILLFLENTAIRYANLVILCEEERYSQLHANPLHWFVLPNVPYFNKLPDLELLERQSSTQLVVGYVGILSTSRNLENLLEIVVKMPEIELWIGGFGELELFVQQLSKQYANIRFFGKTTYDLTLNILSQVDVIAGFYCKTNRNHLFAAPNKYYEALFLEKPLLTTEGTLVGANTNKWNTGFVIGESPEELEQLFRFLLTKDGRQKIREKIDNAQSGWTYQGKDRLNKAFEKYFAAIEYLF